MNIRFNKIFAIIGKRGSGKTLYAIGDSKFNLKGLFNAYVARGIKVIVIDTIDHPAYRKFPIIAMDKFSNFKSGIGRIIVKAQDVPKLNYFLNQHPNTYNSLLFYEDARKHTQAKVDTSLIELIGDSKQKNIDIGFMYHCFAHAPLDLYRYLDYIQLFKTVDTPTARYAALEACIDEANRVYEKVKANPNQFYNLLIDTGNGE